MEPLCFCALLGDGRVVMDSHKGRDKEKESQPHPLQYHLAKLTAQKHILMQLPEEAAAEGNASLLQHISGTSSCEIEASGGSAYKSDEHFCCGDFRMTTGQCDQRNITLQLPEEPLFAKKDKQRLILSPAFVVSRRTKRGAATSKQIDATRIKKCCRRTVVEGDNDSLLIADGQRLPFGRKDDMGSGGHDGLWQSNEASGA